MTLNNYMPNPVKSYPEDFSIDLPVKIHVILYVSEDVQTDINEKIIAPFSIEKALAAFKISD